MNDDKFSVPAFSCRFCGEKVQRLVADLGMTPLCETLIGIEQYDDAEAYYPLQAYVCDNCLLVQLRDCISSRDVYHDEYPYFSSYSKSWLNHARLYVEEIVPKLGLGKGDLVIEVASNDGYLLQYFEPHEIKTLGVEPCRSVAEAAIAKGIRTEMVFLGQDTAKEIRQRHGPAELVVGNNVLPHVPDVRDFVSGLATLIADDGVITMEFPHLANLIRFNQFDTIYHEHFSYLSMHAVRRIFEACGLEIFDVQRLSTHGGSLRIFAQLSAGRRVVQPSLEQTLAQEADQGLTGHAIYDGFVEHARQTKRKILRFLIEAKEAGASVAGYGAPGKGNTLLNFCGIGTDLIEFTVDANPFKHYKFTPGSRLPIFPPEAIKAAKPGYLLILPWNLREEIIEQTAFIRDWGGKWVTPIPEVRVWE
ncbi:MAG: class I SAM-dependent methyltransferase [Roseibium album]|uniref:class I SAM-dependent methyltransferase n=1 Tax=Roseibium album TaxID=311410 RepID=UPI0032EE252B